MFGKRTICSGLFVVLVIGLISAPVFAYGGAKSWVYVDERMYPERTTDEAAAVIDIQEAKPVSAEEGDLIDSSAAFVGDSADTVGNTFVAGADAVGKTAANGADGIGWLFMAVYGSVFEIEKEGAPVYEEPAPAVIEKRKSQYHPRYHGRVGQWTRR